MSHPSPPASGEHDIVLSAHSTIRDCLQSMSGGKPDALREGIDQLARILPVHFAYEEREGGFLARLAKRSGRQVAERLRREHAELLAQLEDVTWRDLGQPDQAALALAFAAALETHEREEGRFAMQWVGGS